MNFRSFVFAVLMLTSMGAAAERIKDIATVLGVRPDSINDGALCNTCAGNQPADPPGLSMIIDWPASYHDGAGSFCFADGRAEIHKWVGTRIKAQMRYAGNLSINVTSGDSWVDMHWLAENTTVGR